MRPNWNEYHLLQAKLAAVRSTCNSRPQGAVLVLDNRIIATGYNGALPGQEHCSDHKPLLLAYSKPDCEFCERSGQIPVGFSGEDQRYVKCPAHIKEIPYCRRRAANIPDAQKDRACVSAHAEANAVAQAARLGAATAGSILYCTTRPCAVCTKILVMAGVVRVFYELDYDDPDSNWLRKLLPMERLEVSCQATELAQEILKPFTSRRRMDRTE